MARKTTTFTFFHWWHISSCFGILVQTSFAVMPAISESYIALMYIHIHYVFCFKTTFLTLKIILRHMEMTVLLQWLMYDFQNTFLSQEQWRGMREHEHFFFLNHLTYFAEKIFSQYWAKSRRASSQFYTDLFSPSRISLILSTHNKYLEKNQQSILSETPNLLDQTPWGPLVSI